VSQQSLGGAGRLRLIVPMVARDPADEHRASTPLELFFDLVFVVAVAFASERLEHGLIEGNVAESAARYMLAFFALWWAWMNFTWFASAYDADDVAYRIFVFVTMTGALIFAAGIPQLFDEFDTRIAVLGYVVMRLALVTQWIRCARADPPRRKTAYRYAVGVGACQIGWIVSVLVPGGWWAVFLVLAPIELLVPVWAESASPTTWHPGHIIERYGLFMIIVLGESVLAASIAIRSATSAGDLGAELIEIIVGGLLIVFSIWWLYFDRPGERWLTSTGSAIVWGYTHLLVFASVAAVGVGLSVAIEDAAGHSELGEAATGISIAAPVAIFLVSTWALYIQSDDPPIHKFGVPVAAACVLAGSFTGTPVLAVGILMGLLVAVKVASRLRTGGELEA
jgi:low temperature requirement protein LtrA